MGANSLESLAGDRDSFGTDKPEGDPVIPIEVTHDPLDGDFDRWALNYFVWEHVFTLPPGVCLTGATLTIVTLDLEDDGEGDGLGGEPYDDRLFIDGVEILGAFDSTFTADGYPIIPNTDTFILGPEFFPLLQDGSITAELNPLGGERKDSIAIDYALFELEFVICVSIDIKPGSYPNSINIGSQGVIPVAILSSSDFDATSVNPETVELAGSGVAIRGKGSKYMVHEEYVDGDDLVDLVVKVETENLDPDTFQDGYAILTAETYDGLQIEGMDEIHIVPPE
jgi:hypothetical protein